jgi:hypothetical protein
VSILSGERGRAGFESPTIDLRNNNNQTNRILHGSPERYLESQNTNFSITASSSQRVPEIQMINRFYGLIPKKFVISERIRAPAPLIRQRRYAAK